MIKKLARVKNNKYRIVGRTYVDTVIFKYNIEAQLKSTFQFNNLKTFFQIFRLQSSPVKKENQAISII